MSSKKWYMLGLATVGVGAYSLWQIQRVDAADIKGNWAEVRKDIAHLLEQKEYDDGSYGPLFVRLAWHASGTYDQFSKTGGSNGATMRFPPESTDGANAGLDIARNALEEVKKRHPNASYADIWTLAGSVAIEEMGGPKIDWLPGRTDIVTNKNVPPNGRLPDALREADHIRAVFYRMGFNDREIVALLGAHCLGRCHTNRSGFSGPWTRAPTTFSNEYFRELIDSQWTEKIWKGPKQYQDSTGELVMLVADLALVKDPNFARFVKLYKEDEEAFFKDFAAAWKKLVELGVPAFNK